MASTLEEGTVVRVVWAADDGEYAVLRVRTGDEEVTVVGPLASVGGGEPIGAFVTLEGRWEEHAYHGPQYRVLNYLEGSPRTIAGIGLYLEQVPGIGPKLAGRIVERFGMETLTVLSKAPWRLGEVKGIKAKVQDIADHWAKDENGRALTILLRSLGLPMRLVERIRRRYGDQARGVVDNEPYRLAEEIAGIGFKTADALARTKGLPADDPARIRAAVVHVLDPDNTDGDCFLDRGSLNLAVSQLGVPTEGVPAAVDRLAREGRVVLEGDRIWTAELYVAECDVAAALIARTGGLAPPAGWLDDVARAEQACGVKLADTQREAVFSALNGGPRIITGGPGTGKTTLVRVLLAAANARGLTMKLASPTGRASKRLSEATGGEATTLHRLLAFNPGEGGFQRNGGDPIVAQALVVDEMSMVDLLLMQALLDALPRDPGFPLILVGDADQLPSVGPGRILADLVASGRIPVTRLEHVYRQEARSGILDAATRVHGGTIPLSGEHGGFGDCFLLAREEPERVVETVLEVTATRLVGRGFDARTDVQVLTPTRKGALGTEALNRALQARLNPDGKPFRRADRELRVGDRVICTKNRYDFEVWNGDVGRVIGLSGRELHLSFDGRTVPWPVEELNQIDLAYAMTVHKSQGSEYPAVVLVLHGAHSIMLRRNLFYTAITRAKKFLCVVGSPRAWARAAENTDGEQRKTGLAERLRNPSHAG